MNVCHGMRRDEEAYWERERLRWDVFFFFCEREVDRDDDLKQGSCIRGMTVSLTVPASTGAALSSMMVMPVLAVIIHCWRFTRTSELVSAVFAVGGRNDDGYLLYHRYRCWWCDWKTEVRT